MSLLLHALTSTAVELNRRWSWHGCAITHVFSPICTVSFYHVHLKQYCTQRGCYICFRGYYRYNTVFCWLNYPLSPMGTHYSTMCLSSPEETCSYQSRLQAEERGRDYFHHNNAFTFMLVTYFPRTTKRIHHYLKEWSIYHAHPHPIGPWWRHQMETFSALPALCAAISPVSGEFPAQRPVTRSFDVFFDLRPNKRLSKQSWCWSFETLSSQLWRHCNVHFTNRD